MFTKPPRVLSRTDGGTTRKDKYSQNIAQWHIYIFLATDPNVHVGNLYIQTAVYIYRLYLMCNSFRKSLKPFLPHKEQSWEELVCALCPLLWNTAGFSSFHSLVHIRRERRLQLPLPSTCDPSGFLVILKSFSQQASNRCYQKPIQRSPSMPNGLNRLMSPGALWFL